jgi:hypothetical protein
LGLTEVTGVLSRYFVVGFFLPAYVSLIALWLTASDNFIPNALDRYSEATELVILGGVALVFALVLSGLNYPLVRWFEGYPLQRLRRWPGLKLVPNAAIALQRWAYNRLVKIRDDQDQPEQDRKRTYTRLDKDFPKSPSALLPTRLGNVMRAYERHSNVRWGIDGLTIWPRVSALVSDAERQLLVDAEIDLFVFLNAAFGALVVGICLVVDKAIHGNGLWEWLLYAIPFLVAYALYRMSIGPAVSRGAVVRASIDLHRLEVYEKLGVRKPNSFSDERELGKAVGQLLLYGEPWLPDDRWDDGDQGQGDGGEQRGQLFALIEEWIRRSRL